MSSELADVAAAQLDLPALIASRICHDLISPIGAIGNGVELLSMAGGGAGPELSLIGDSVANANARIRFYRIAFGMAGKAQGVARNEIASILAGMYGDSRLKIAWEVSGDCRRDEVKAAFLAILCMESALPLGGEIRVARSEGFWRIAGSGQKMKVDPEIWGLLDGRPVPTLTPALVHFALLAEAAARLKRRVTRTQGDISASISF